MNIHEHQAKKVLKEFGAPVPNGIVVYTIDEISKNIQTLKSKSTKNREIRTKSTNSCWW